MPQSLDSFDNDYYTGHPPQLGNTPDLRATNEGQLPQSAGNPNDPFGGERFRGSSELPLTPEGLMKAHSLAQKIAAKGGLDRIMTSNLGRTIQTAKILSHYTHAPITYVGEGLRDWAYGGLEGQPVTQDNIDFLHHLVAYEPDIKLPGRGPLSTVDGESFNDFRTRVLPFVQKVLGESRGRPQEKTGLVTHQRVIKLINAWMRNGMQDDHSVDAGEMTLNTTGRPPGSLERLHVDQFAGPQMSSVDMDNPGHLTGGLYLIRHEATPWNKKSSGPGS